ncbi:MAG: cytochrome C [bacterium]|nr:cytochrome C [bacterium]
MSSPSTCIRRLGSAYLVAVLWLYAPAVAAQNWERLIMPGPVIEAHAEFEGECSQCHRPFRKLEQRELCLDCHDHAPIADDINALAGFHGGATVRSVECSRCHTEHIGREADVVGLDPSSFDHSLTDYALRGRHRTASCAKCHETGRPHREAPAKCSDCHGEDDPHRGALGETCADCHDESSWRKAEFEHSKTEFPLIGRHAKVPCVSCHPDEHYSPTPTDCISCHDGVHDPHAGRYGRDCRTCHTAHGWDRIEFQHDKDTDFALRGSHRSLACDSCHTGPSIQDKLERSCATCHRADDQHKGRFGENCVECHSEKSWKDEKFDHGQTVFPLHGAHRSVSCLRCHTGVLEKAEVTRTCQNCHPGDDVHAGQQGESCEQCHNAEGWTKRVFFEHDLTRFPLLGVHAAAACEECHTNSRFQDTSTSCQECHASHDFHKGTMGSECSHCHNPNGWNFWTFDHAQQTDFALDGAHEGRLCHDCHTTRVQGKLSRSSSCNSCHRDDDIHLSRFGIDCARCHTNERWNVIRRIR